MRRISDTIARLAAANISGSSAPSGAPGRLRSFEDFGVNPGALKAHLYTPVAMPAGAPLVVVLHGCTQSAASYDRASGWSDLADREGFALLYPEQQRTNNANGCFNWFEPGDTMRGRGEALSIRQMIDSAQKRFRLDPSRIFITGLSAGGAMAATMLAVYPEVFAGGAIIAGLPHGSAQGMVQAFDRMRGHGLPSTAELVSSLRAGSEYDGPWPRISIWHGSADMTVSVHNADALGAQWRGVHKLGSEPSIVDRIDGVPHRLWMGPDERALVEEYIVPGMAHGTPIKCSGAGALGSSAPFMLNVGISSTLRTAEFWGIVTPSADHVARSNQPSATLTTPARIEPQRLQGRRIAPETARGVGGVTKIIEDALKAAGLLK